MGDKTFTLASPVPCKNLTYFRLALLAYFECKPRKRYLLAKCKWFPGVYKENVIACETLFDRRADVWKVFMSRYEGKRAMIASPVPSDIF